MAYESNLNEILNHIRKATKDSLEEIKQVAVTSTQAITPVDTGRLRASIEGRDVGDSAIEIGTSVHYSLYVEKGTSKQKAQPYLQPGVLREIDTYKDILEKNLNK